MKTSRVRENWMCRIKGDGFRKRVFLGALRPRETESPGERSQRNPTDKGVVPDPISCFSPVVSLIFEVSHLFLALLLKMNWEASGH